MWSLQSGLSTDETFVSAHSKSASVSASASVESGDENLRSGLGSSSCNAVVESGNITETEASNVTGSSDGG